MRLFGPRNPGDKTEIDTTRLVISEQFTKHFSTHITWSSY